MRKPILSGIERIIGAEQTQKLTRSRAYKFTADAIAMNIFSLVYGVHEKFLAGMEWDEVGKTRLAAAIGNTITGRPYGIWRDYVFSKTNTTNESSQLKKYGADVMAFVTGQTPLYAAYLALGGGSMKEIASAAIFLTVAAPLLGRPQGTTYDFCRNQLGVPSTKEKQHDNNK